MKIIFKRGFNVVEILYGKRSHMEDLVFNPKEESFSSKEKYEQYKEKTRCAICYKRLKKGDIFQLRPIQTREETGCLDVLAVVVHKKCLER